MTRTNLLLFLPTIINRREPISQCCYFLFSFVKNRTCYFQYNVLQSQTRGNLKRTHLGSNFIDIPSKPSPGQQKFLTRWKFVQVLLHCPHDFLEIKTPTNSLPRIAFQMSWLRTGHSMLILFQRCTPTPVTIQVSNNY